jgi:hypothetical protein
VTVQQLAAIAAAAGTPNSGVASGGTGGSSAGATSEPPPITTNSGDAGTLALNGNNPATILNATFSDLGALFTHDGIAETVMSTSTIDTSMAGTSTLDYWAVVPATQQVLHATREVVIQSPANDNPPATTNALTTPQAANDNPPPLAPTGTDTSAE